MYPPNRPIGQYPPSQPSGYYPPKGEYSPPPAGYYSGTPMQHPKASSVMWMGIISLLLVLFLSWICTPCLLIGVVLGVIAVFQGLAARKEIRANPRMYTGDGNLLAGIVCGGISLGIGALLLILFVLVFLLYFAAIMSAFAM